MTCSISIFSGSPDFSTLTPPTSKTAAFWLSFGFSLLDWVKRLLGAISQTEVNSLKIFAVLKYLDLEAFEPQICRIFPQFIHFIQGKINVSPPSTEQELSYNKPLSTKFGIISEYFQVCSQNNKSKKRGVLESPYFPCRRTGFDS